MKVTRETENNYLTIILVEPWPEYQFGSRVQVTQVKYDLATGEPCRNVQVDYGNWRTEAKIAREFAKAILRACDIAEQLERDGAIVLESEEVLA